MRQQWIILMLVTSTYLWADAYSLQAKIAKLQTLPKSERFMLMNEIKRDLARMNESQRREALGKLRASMHRKGQRYGLGKSGHKSMGKGHGNHQPLRMHKGIQEHIRPNHEQKRARQPKHQKRPDIYKRPLNLPNEK